MSAPQVLPHDWFPAPLPANVILGERTWLYSAYAFLHYRSERTCGLRVGHDTGIYTETFFDLGPHGAVEIGDYCTVAGPIFATNGLVVIGNHVLISREVVIADAFDGVPPLPGPGLTARRPRPAADIHVGDCAWIGSRSILLAGAQLGAGAIVGAGAVVDFAVPPYAIVAGNPATIVGWARPPQ
jgi:acetyltransferase-like isoleucine patch superfamily enzyme